MTGKVIKILKTAKGALFADPKLLYEEERHLLNQPFYFEGNNNKAALLIHGWSSVPYEVRRLGKFLNENGYTVSGPMLRGHGTVPKDLENIKWNEWFNDVEKNYLELKSKYNQVYIGGTSLGANLSILLAAKYPEISGLVLMATPYKFKLEKLAYFFVRFSLNFVRYRKKFYPPTFGVSTTITRLISYQSYPLKSALEAFELVKQSRENLHLVQQPCFLLQSKHDHMTVKNNMELIYDRIGSKIKKKKYMERAYHTFISDVKNEHVFQEVLNFIQRN